MTRKGISVKDNRWRTWHTCPGAMHLLGTASVATPLSCYSVLEDAQSRQQKRCYVGAFFTPNKGARHVRVGSHPLRCLASLNARVNIKQAGRTQK